MTQQARRAHRVERLRPTAKVLSTLSPVEEIMKDFKLWIEKALALAIAVLAGGLIALILSTIIGVVKSFPWR